MENCWARSKFNMVMAIILKETCKILKRMAAVSSNSPREPCLRGNFKMIKQFQARFCIKTDKDTSVKCRISKEAVKGHITTTMEQ